MWRKDSVSYVKGRIASETQWDKASYAGFYAWIKSTLSISMSGWI